MVVRVKGVKSSHDAFKFLCLFPKSAQFEATRRDYTAERAQRALCAGDDGHTVPRHYSADAGVVDKLSGTLWMGWNLVPLHLGLFRSDYLLHAAGDRLPLKQVEFNAISSSSFLGSLSERVAAMHRCIHVIVPPQSH
ncbi:hypothetical protein M405DRAFT_803417 [Rhizopogon salebrosus TDB-379]|nr:hypothetical protein M405DRAFT_803417 [Rhizopogon salebrosus TDB-379]